MSAIDPARLERAACALPLGLIRAVEEYVTTAHEDARKYENSEPLDTSGVFSLHRLAARIYAAGWDDGERAADEKTRAQRRRERQEKTNGA